MSRTVQYDFAFEDNSSWSYELQFDEQHHFIPKEKSEIKEWTRLEFFKCPHCPLSNQEHPQCPVARNLDQVVEDSKDTLSCTRAQVRVTTPERRYEKNCDTQEGLRSLFGLVMASSGCPHLDWLRPLARFHLPFSDTDETIFRVLAVELLRQFFENKQGEIGDCAGVIQGRYEGVIKVNHTFIERIRAYCKEDADKNAIAALDCYAQLFPFQMEAKFQSVEKYFR